MRLPPSTVSSGCRLLVAPTKTATPRMPAAIAAIVHHADRIVHSLLASERSTSVKPGRTGRPTVAGHRRPSSPLPVMARYDLLEGGAPRGELVQLELVPDGDGADRGRVRSHHPPLSVLLRLGSRPHGLQPWPQPLPVGRPHQGGRPEPRRISSRMLVSASSRPRPMTIRWSAVSSISLIRWLETKTVRPSAASPRSSCGSRGCPPGPAR